MRAQIVAQALCLHQEHLSPGKQGVTLHTCNISFRNKLASFYSSAVTIGFENTEYSTDEGTTVEVCVVILSGTLAREVTVTLTSSDDTAEGG